MDQPLPTRRPAVRIAVAGAAALLVALVAVGAWRWALQRVSLVVVNQSAAAAQLTYQPQLFADRATITIEPCTSTSIDLGGGQSWRLEADGLDINANAVDRPWLTPRIAFEIWLDPGGSSRITGPYVIDAVVSAPAPSGCQ
jgi:hypothetical protein